MTDFLYFNFFGNPSDFENLKKWYRINSDIYKDLVAASKERCDLEVEYSTKLAKIGAKILKSFNQSIGSVSSSWSKTAHVIIEESEVHKHYSTSLYEEFYKPMITISETFTKSKKPVETEIDKCYKTFQEKRDEEMRLKKKANSSMRDSEKAFESIEDYLRTHPTSVQGTDKERAKIEKRAYQMKEASTKAETEYFDSAMIAEESRHRWEHNYLNGLEKLQSFETDRLQGMKSVLEDYHKIMSRVPTSYAAICEKLLSHCQSANVPEDLTDNCNHHTNKSPTQYATEQYLLELYSEIKDNPMDQARRLENISKRISVLYQNQNTYDNIRIGALKMIKVYEEKPEFCDDLTKNKTRREYGKNQSMVNYLSANIYKLQLALCAAQGQPEPTNPLPVGQMQLRSRTTSDRGGLVQAVLISAPGSVLSPSSRPSGLALSSIGGGSSVGATRLNHSMSTVSSVAASASTVDDDPDVFDSDSEFDSDDTSPPVQSQRPPLNKAASSVVRPLPTIPGKPTCVALHSFEGRDKDELSFQEGDVLSIINKINDVWWQAEFQGRPGLIPANYVKEGQR